MINYFRIADDLESHSQQALKHPENHLANPVSAFLFTKRFTLDWEREVDSLLKASNNIQGEAIFDPPSH